MARKRRSGSRSAASPRYPQRGLHKGYRYQDLVAAIAFARAIQDENEPVDIERARFEGDRFDDVALPSEGQQVRVQVKHSENAEPFEEGIFLGDDQRLQIDVLVSAYAEDPDADVTLRLFSNRTLPSDPGNGWFLAPSSAAALFPGLPSQRYALNAAEIWPAGKRPRWSVLESVSRDDFVRFAARLVVELAAPSMSGELASPGPLETYLVSTLRDELGVHRPPNNRPPEDIASRLLEVAGSGRGRRKRRFSIADLIREAALRVDRGRIAQSYPLDSARYVRTHALGDVLDALSREARLLVTGPPGSGKSWCLERLSRELRKRGWVVARHYCFLQPGDPDVQQRAALDVMTGNLTSELLDDERLSDVHVGLSGDIRALESCLEEAAALVETADSRAPKGKSRAPKGRSRAPKGKSRAPKGKSRAPLKGILLVVDGLDHVSRIDLPHQAGRRRLFEFADTLAKLALPKNVRLVVGSQPGEHLDGLREVGAQQLTMPTFSAADTARQLVRLGVFSALRKHGLAADRRAVFRAISEKAGGNPLVTRFLSEMTLGSLVGDGSSPPSVVVARLPILPGDLTSYYEHLLADADAAPDAGVIAELLSAVDFAVSIRDLEEFLPLHGRKRIEGALVHLRPVLATSGAQGGSRIFHESLRRFVTARLAREGRDPKELFAAVATWLEKRAFFADDRAYRCLLPTLRRAGRSREILERVTPDFVARSVVALQPQRSVEANLAVATQVAADNQDFPSLARLVELGRATTIAYEEKLGDHEAYARAVIQLEGANRLAERLLFEGRPTYSRRLGLRLCAMCDESGGAAPWSAYLDLASESRDRRDSEQRQRDSLDDLHGNLRTAPGEMREVVRRWLTKRSPKASGGFARGVARRVLTVLGAAALDEMLASVPDARPAVLRWFFLELADDYARNGRHDDAKRAALQALEYKAPPETFKLLHRLGVDASKLAARCPPPRRLLLSLLSERPEALAVSRFVNAVHVHGAAGRDLKAVRLAIEDSGWFGRWLCFVIDATEVRAGRLTGLVAIERLAAKTTFSGSLRPLDMYGLQEPIQGEIRDFVDLLSAEDLAAAVPHLFKVSRKTTVYFQGEPVGPMPVWPLLRMLLPRAHHLPVQAIADLVRKDWDSEYYDYHAQTSLLLAQLWAGVGASAAADAEWQAAGAFLSGYGNHKEITIFDLIEGLEPIGQVDLVAARERVRRLHPLVERTLDHSDGKETRHAPNAWFEQAARLTPGAAARALATTMLRKARVPTERYEKAHAEALTAAPACVSPFLVHALWRALPARDHHAERLRCVARLLEGDRARGAEALAEVAAAFDGDGEKRSDEPAGLVERFVSAHGLSCEGLGRVPELRATKSAESSASTEKAPRRNGPFLSAGLSPLKLIAELREHRLDSFDDPIDHEVFAAELIRELWALFSRLGPEAVVDVVVDFAYRQAFRERAHVIERLAETFVSSAPELASEILVLAWCASQSGSWLVFGGAKHLDLVRRAAEVSRPAALARLAAETARSLEKWGSPLGLTQRIVEGLVAIGEGPTAVRAWDSAFEVVAARLPKTGGETDVFEALGPDLGDPETELAYAELLATGVASIEFERRACAVAGLLEYGRRSPESLLGALEVLVGEDAQFSEKAVAVQIAADVVGVAQVKIHLPKEALRRAAKSDSFFVRHRAHEALGTSAAGETDPPPVAVPLVRVPSVSDFRGAMSNDEPGRAKTISELWKPFAETVAGRFWATWRAAERRNSSIFSAQHDICHSRSATWVPPLRVYDWPHEVFDREVDRAVFDLRDHAFASGEWTPGLVRWLLKVLSCDIVGAGARGRSRIVRPVGPLPRDQKPGSSAPLVRDSGELSSWVRAAYWEEEIEEVKRDLGRRHKVYAGLWTGAADPLEEEFPLSPVAPDFRWHDQADEDWGIEVGQPLGSRVCALWGRFDATMWDLGLTLDRQYLRRLDLRPADAPGPFDLLNGSGQVAAIYRHWRMRPYDYTYHPALPLIHGGELLISPAVAESVAKLSGRDLLEVTVVRREDLLEQPT
jgi:hypothetical protein